MRTQKQLIKTTCPELKTIFINIYLKESMKEIQFDNKIDKKRRFFLSEYSIISAKLDISYKVKIMRVLNLDSIKMKKLFFRLFSNGK
jgi:hypothetical protein